MSLHEFPPEPSPFLPPLDLESEPQGRFAAIPGDPALTEECNRGLDAYATYFQADAADYDERFGGPSGEISDKACAIAEDFAQKGEVKAALYIYWTRRHGGQTPQ